MKTIKIISSGILLASALVTLSACGSSGSKDSKGSDVKLPSLEDRYKPSEDKPAWQMDSKKNKKLTWYINADWWNKKYGTDLVTKKIKEDLNLDITFVTGDDTKLNTMFASGKKPDIISVFDMTSQVAQTANKWAYSLDDLSKNYDPYWNKVASKDTLNWYKLSDGKTYGYPAYSNTEQDYKAGTIKPVEATIIREDIYNALGKPKMDTPESFVKVMKDIKAKYPQTTPFGFAPLLTANISSLDATVQDLLGVPYYKDGKIYDRNTDKDYLTWLKAFRQVHQDGGISDDSFTANEEKYKQAISGGKYACIAMGGAIGQGTPLQEWNVKNPKAKYIAVDGIKSTENRKPVLNQTGISGWMINYVTKDSKDPATAMQIFTYLQSKYGNMLANYGVEGKTYNMENGKAILTPETRNMQKTAPTKFASDLRLGEFVQFGHDKYKDISPDAYQESVKPIFEWGKNYLTPEFPTENTAPDTNTPEARNWATLNTKWLNTLVSAVRASSESKFDEVFDQYKTFRKSNGYENIVKVRDKKVQENLKKLGMPKDASTPTD